MVAGASRPAAARAPAKAGPLPTGFPVEVGADRIGVRLAWPRSFRSGAQPRPGCLAARKQDRGARDADQGSNYGVGAVVVQNQTTIAKPPTTVNNINQMEKRHNGVEVPTLSHPLARRSASVPRHTGAD